MLGREAPPHVGVQILRAKIKLQITGKQRSSLVCLGQSWSTVARQARNNSLGCTGTGRQASCSWWPSVWACDGMGLLVQMGSLEHVGSVR